MASPDGRWFPPEWPGRVRAWARGELAPVAPRRAATVLLLRDRPGGGGPEVFLLRRRGSMAFAAGVYAYPGGSVDPRDAGTLAGSGGGSGGAAWGARLGVAEAEAGAVVRAALRETFEETGVLLAGPAAGGGIVADTTGPEWEADRAALAARELPFAELLARRSLVPRGDLLAAWARWITPEFEARRYDAWFFVAALPDGQRTRNASTESDRAVWLTPREALAGYDGGRLRMLPPTVATLRRLAGCASAAAALAAAPAAVAPVMARVRAEGGRVEVRWPGHGEFDTYFEADGGIGGRVE